MDRPDQEHEVYVGPAQPSSVRRFACHEVGNTTMNKLTATLRNVYQQAMRGGVCNDHDPIGRIRPVDAKRAAETIERLIGVADELEKRAEQMHFDTTETRHLCFKFEGYREAVRLIRNALQ